MAKMRKRYVLRQCPGLDEPDAPIHEWAVWKDFVTFDKMVKFVAALPSPRYKAVKNTTVYGFHLVDTWAAPCAMVYYPDVDYSRGK